MKNIYSEIVRVLSSGTPAALATIYEVIGSSPRGVGAKYLVRKDRSAFGSLGGGCLEAKVWQGAIDSINSSKNILMKFDLTDKDMTDSGLICGGTVAIFVEPLQSSKGNLFDLYQKVKEMREQGKRGVLATVRSRGSTPVSPLASKILLEIGGEKWGALSEGEAFETEIRRWCESNPLKKLRVQPFSLNDGQYVNILLESITTDPTLYIFGAGHIAEALSPLAKMAAFKVVVIDDRPMFANPERFPEADEVLVESFELVFDKLHIDAQSYIVIVTRGHLYDGVVLEQTIRTRAGYIGMIGSKRKIAILYKGLKEKGVPEELLARVYAPIGIDIHSETPGEIAISIIAQLVKVRADNEMDRIRRHSFYESDPIDHSSG